jgi:hypothetical protein
MVKVLVFNNPNILNLLRSFLLEEKLCSLSEQLMKLFLGLLSLTSLLLVLGLLDFVEFLDPTFLGPELPML